MRRHHVSLGILIAIVIFTFSSLISAQTTSPVFRIGVLGDERGALANGARLAIREINARGGVRGADGTFFQLELVIEPIEPEGSTMNAVEALANARVIAILGPETTEQVLSSLPLLQSLNVPILTPATGDTVIASDQTGLLFRIRAAERWQGSALADLLINEARLTEVTTVQLDRNSTGARVGFSVALTEASPAPTESTIILDVNQTIGDIVTQVMLTQPVFVAAFGAPDLAAEFYNQLRDAGWLGIYAYHQADTQQFRENVDFDQLQGVLGTNSWTFNAPNPESVAFVDAYINAYGELPDAISAASYDAINLIAAAIGQTGNLVTNLVTVRDVVGVQGVLNPTGFSGNEFSNNVVLIQLGSFGGSQLLARYMGRERLPLIPIAPTEVVAVSTPTPQPTATLDGVYIKVTGARQNVRSGPGTNYDVIGQLQNGEQFRVIGANIDFTWVVIEYRGGLGWLSTDIAEVTGNRNTVAIVAAPPTPTPGATSTPAPLPFPDVVIVSASPTTITWNTPTIINVNVRNLGGVNAGPFAIASSFDPGAVFASYNFSGLGAGLEQTVPLTPSLTLSGATGIYSAIIIADLNNEVNESTGESNNNIYNFTYKLDRPLLLINNATLTTGASLDLEVNAVPTYDITYSGGGLNTTGTCTATTYCMGVLGAVNWDTSHYDYITGANGVNTTSIANGALVPGTILGVFTAEGRRAIIRIDSINAGISISFTYRVYGP
ncbi:MAG: ABC transporter substrate-binding protein [bacterium]|nr:ABC transporter substrate-binding protein [bacterium]